MKIIRLKLLLLVVCVFSCKTNNNTSIQMLPEKEVVEEYFGTTVKDPYRYMEDLNDTIVLNWYKQQSNYAKNKIHKIDNRNKILDFQNIITNNSSEISNILITSNNLCFYLKNHNDTKELFYREGIHGEEYFLFNPEKYKKGSAINYIAPSWDGSKVAIAITKNDLEIGNIIVLDVQNKKRYNESINNCWPSALGGIRWLADNSRFTYEYIPVIDKKEKNYLFNTETRLHVLGENPVNDRILFSKKNNPEIKIKEEDFPEVSISNEKSNYIFGSIWGASYYADYYYSSIENINNQKITWKSLFKKEDLIKRFYLEGDYIVYLSAKKAENFEICRTSLINPNFEDPEILVSEDESSVITDLTLTSKGMFFVKTKNGVEAKLYQFINKNKINNITLPKEAGYINVSSNGNLFPDLRIEIKGWLSDKERYQFNHKTNQFTKEQLAKENGNNDELFDGIIIEEIEIISHDGVKVPLSLIYNKDLELNGQNRVLIKGYGAYGITQKPFLDPYILPWLKEGGIYAMAHVRGGGEKGDFWHKSGYKETKPNTWKDLIACSEYLIHKKYSSSSKTVIYSGSAGGILIGRAITERPDLFAAAIIRVGVLNTLRYEFSPNGKNNTKELGSVQDSIGFKGLLEMDAYQHIEKGVKYPAVYLTAGLNDSRVSVWQPGKFAAKLQAATTSNNPVFLNVDSEGGHGLDTSKNKKNKEIADILSFALWQTGHPDFQLK